jgi:pimeloyl-ACP methyl ester carboxylesterase
MQGTWFGAVSTDGTAVACEVVGQGPALLYVHGTADDRQGFDRVAPLLADSFTVFMMDRRGRGLSGDNPRYHLAREYEDVAEMASAIAAVRGRPVDVFSHSYGALCVIGAARTSDALGRLMFYEPPPGTPSVLVDKMVGLTEAGDLEGVMRVQFCELQQLPVAAFERLKENPERWQRYLDFAPTIAREFVNARRMRIRAGEFADYPHAVRFLVGEVTFPPLAQYTDRGLLAFPRATKKILPGQAHAAMRAAPEMVAKEIGEFFD